MCGSASATSEHQTVAAPVSVIIPFGREWPLKQESWDGIQRLMLIRVLNPVIFEDQNTFT